MKKLLLVFVAVLSISSVTFAQPKCLKGNCFNGYSICIFPSGAKYEGEFLDGYLHGKGTIFFTNGDQYSGRWVRHYREGEGKLVFANGDEYQGEFRKNKFHGEGAMAYQNGNRYQGTWENNQPHGYGEFSFANGNRYEGTFQEGRREGLGTLYYADRSRYEGEWSDNKRHGQGTLFLSERVIGKGDNGLRMNIGPTGKILASTAIPPGFAIAMLGIVIWGLGNLPTKMVLNFSENLPVDFREAMVPCTTAMATGTKEDWEEHAPHGKGVMYYATGKVVGALWEFRSADEGVFYR